MAGKEKMKLQKEGKAKKALVAIVQYIRGFKPKGEQALQAQLKVIEEIAIGALEEKLA